MRINEELKKYCYNCGKIIAFSDVWCKYCGEDLKHYEKQSKIRETIFRAYGRYDGLDEKIRDRQTADLV